ncbi:hypothetical protein LJC19_04800 [Oxalobacter sp. OttesenSCG-928-P03]|nr:hypothetical protein [Oxalobacter sp. OttesenSCG-928-P03]
MFDEFKNPDGTYNGARLLSRISGLSEDEVLWTWNRAKEMREDGASRDEVRKALRVMSQELRQKRESSETK